MRRPALTRRFANLRFRLLIFMVAGLIFAGASFEILLVALTRHWLMEETEDHARALAVQVAERAVTPLVLGDSLSLADQLRSAAVQSELAGVEVIDAHGRHLATTAAPSLWAALGPAPFRAASRAPAPARVWRGARLLEVTVPVMRQVATTLDPLQEPDLIAGAGRARVPVHRERVGWVRAVASLDRVEAEVATAAHMGLMVLLLALLLGIVALAVLARFMVRPLREASALAGEIAAGRLDCRLPVRSDDEIGTLATSLNTMAGALLDARHRVEAEAEALRVATSAMVEIGKGVRTARDAAAVFAVVAREIRRVTGCDGVALAVPEGDSQVLVFRQLDPELPWGRLATLPAPGPDTVPAESLAPRPLALDAAGDGLGAALRREGFVSALRVPLVVDGGAPSLLLLASRRADAFANPEVDVVGGLASHLSAALKAARLNDRLQDAFGELQRTHDYLVRSEMLRVAGEMASGVAHEFNNVLGAILGRAELLSLRAVSGGLATEELVESLAVIERAALDGRETGRRLRQFGRSHEAAGAEPVDLDRALRDAVEFTRPRWENEAQAAGRGIEISVDSRPGLVVHGRGHEMREVFTNLVLNAVDALPPQGGHIRLSAYLDGGRVMTTVEDDGVGMDEDTRQRLFEPFFSTKGPAGTGLGMSLVYGIVQRCEGTIEVDSAPGQGTRVTMSFPAADAPERVESTLSIIPEGQPQARALEVLVVDDEPTVRDVLQDMVSTLGHRVVSCNSGQDALREYRPGRFQLVLTDIGMPGMTGWKLAETVRANDRRTVIVFVTGWGEEVNTEAARKSGVDLVVTKPFSLEDILEATRFATVRIEEAEQAEAA